MKNRHAYKLSPTGKSVRHHCRKSKGCRPRKAQKQMVSLSFSTHNVSWVPRAIPILQLGDRSNWFDNTVRQGSEMSNLQTLTSSEEPAFSIVKRSLHLMSALRTPPPPLLVLHHVAVFPTFLSGTSGWLSATSRSGISPTYLETIDLAAAPSLTKFDSCPQYYGFSGNFNEARMNYIQVPGRILNEVRR